MKKYETPTMEIITFEVEDVIVTSGWEEKIDETPLG